MLFINKSVGFVILFLRWILFALLVSCGANDDVVHERIFTFGTIVDISINKKDISKTEVHKAITEIQKELEFLDTELDPWKVGTLARTNTLLTSGEIFESTPNMISLIKQSSKLSYLSNGLFNPAIGKLIKLWGFDREAAEIKKPPSHEQIAQLVQSNPRMVDIIIDGNKIHSRNMDAYLDFGAFAKGYAVDRAIEKLKSVGIRNAIINAGGDLRAIGERGSRAWRIGVRHPRKNTVLAAIDIQGDESVFTSGDYERFFIYQGHRFHHILDPTSGYPPHHTTSVTVIHSNAAVADAAATALFIAGPNRWQPVARKLGIFYVMLIDQHGMIHMNPKMAKRIQFVASPAPKFKISEQL